MYLSGVARPYTLAMSGVASICKLWCVNMHLLYILYLSKSPQTIQFSLLICTFVTACMYMYSSVCTVYVFLGIIMYHVRCKLFFTSCYRLQLIQPKLPKAHSSQQKSHHHHKSYLERKPALQLPRSKSAMMMLLILNICHCKTARCQVYPCKCREYK